ncbi:MAG: hypothetical protein ACYTE3_26140, partial [Planctomycetota bacterium]
PAERRRPGDLKLEGSGMLGCDGNVRFLNSSGGPIGLGCNDGGQADIGRPRPPSRLKLPHNRPRRDRGLAGGQDIAR